MKRIALSLAIIATIAMFAVGATGAYFTDQKVVAGNTFAAGNVKIDIRGAGATPQHLTNMAPGVWTDPVEYDVYNLANSLPVKYRFTDNAVSESVPGYYDKINVIVRHTFAGTSNPGGWPIVYQGSLRNLLVDSTATSGIISSTLGTNITHVFYMQFELDSSAGNVYQGLPLLLTSCLMQHKLTMVDGRNNRSLRVGNIFLDSIKL
ncbi:MAG: SipW-dependent-type signal peptide-containing protein [Patescibacteria group bacterium]